MVVNEQAALLRKLSQLDVEGWTESDVREDFIAPLLRLLGYEKGSDYDINRESEHLLSKPFLMIGSKKQKLDYALVVRKRTFWILEAKRPDPRRVSDDAVFQSHFYALHPEVRARYFGVCNGREIVLHDVRAVDESYTPLFRCEARELPARFEELARLIGAGSLVRSLKDRVLEDTRVLLSSEVREEQVRQFSAELQKVLREVEPQVRQNRVDVWRRKQQEHERGLQDLANEAEILDIPRVVLEFTKNRAELDLAHQSFNAKWERLDSEARTACLTKIAESLYEVPGSLHRFNVLALLLRYPHFALTSEAVRSFVKEALSGFEQRPAAKAQWKLEAVLHRAIYKASFASQALLRDFQRAADEKRRNLSDEELIWRDPSVWSERHAWIRPRIDAIWHRFCRAPTTVVHGLISELEELERQVEEACGDEIRGRTASEGDLTWFPDYDRPFDYMRSTLFGVLEPELAAADRLLEDSDLDAIAALLRRVCDTYTVNHGDTLWTRLNAKRGRVVMSTELPAAVLDRLAGEDVASFICRAHVHRRGVSALLDGLRAWGKGANEFLELFIRLDVDSRAVIVEDGAPLQ